MVFLPEGQRGKWLVFFLAMVFLTLYTIQGALPQEISASESRSLPAASDTHHQNTVILYYRETLGGAREAMESVSLAVFNDGYLLISRPAYMKLAGTFETYLESNTLDHLWHMLTDKKILEFDSTLLRNKIQEIRQQQRRLFPAIESISDAPTTLIEIYPNRYPSSDMFEQGDWNAKKNISWYGLQWTAERFPNMEEIQFLLSIQQQLTALMERPDLKKIK